MPGVWPGKAMTPPRDTRDETCRYRDKGPIRCGAPAEFVARWDKQGAAPAFLCERHAFHSERVEYQAIADYRAEVDRG